MKKKLLVLIVCAVSVLGASATILFTSSCGKQVYTVGPEYFDEEDEDDQEFSAEAYYEWLDAYLCGEGNNNSN